MKMMRFTGVKLLVWDHKVNNWCSLDLTPSQNFFKTPNGAEASPPLLCRGRVGRGRERGRDPVSPDGSLLGACIRIRRVVVVMGTGLVGGGRETLGVCARASA
jgi:hypothetical protein